MKNKVDFIKLVLGVVLFVVAILLAYDAQTTRQRLTTESKATIEGREQPQVVCGKLKITPYELVNDQVASCPTDDKVRTNILKYGMRLKISSTDGQPHTITYDLVDAHCLKGNARPCNDNVVGGRNLTAVVPATGELTLEVNKPSSNGQACGSWQTDYVIHTIDSNKCNFVWGDHKSDVLAGLCYTNSQCSAVVPTPIPAAPLGSVSANPVTVCVNKPVTISGSANANGTLQQADLYVVRADGKDFPCPVALTKDAFGNGFCLLSSTANANPSTTWTPTEAGNYKAVINVLNNAGGKCGGNPFVTSWPSPAGFTFCGNDSRKDITVLAATDPSCATPVVAGPTNTPTPTPTPTRTPTLTPTPSPTPAGLRSCNNTCTADSQCGTGYCFNGACRNPACSNKVNCTCDVAQAPTLTPTPSPTVTPTATPPPGKQACSATCTSDSQCATGFCDNDAGMCRNRACQFETDCSCPVVNTPTPTPTEIIVAVNNSAPQPTSPPPSIPSAGMPSAKWGFLAIPAAMLLLGLLF